MNCPVCGTHMIWKVDHDMMEDSEGELEMSSSYDCPNEECGVWVEIIYPNKEYKHE